LIGDVTLDGEVGEGFEDAAAKHPTGFSLDIRLEPQPDEI
jgi:hypothetical protein